MDAGDNYGKIKPVYVMGFLNFTPLADNPQFYSEYTFLDTITHKRYSDLASIRIVDMTRIEEARELPLEQAVARWASMFAADSMEELERLAEGDEILKEMVVTFAELSEEEKIRQQCMAREDYYRRQAGMKRQGVEETNRRVAFEMLEDNYPIDVISKISHLSEAEVLALKNNM